MKFVIRSMVAVSLVVSPTCGMKAPTQRGQHRQLAGRTVLQQEWDKAMKGKTGSNTMAKVEHHRFNIHTQRKKERDAERDRIGALRRGDYEAAGTAYDNLFDHFTTST